MKIQDIAEKMAQGDEEFDDEIFYHPDSVYEYTVDDRLYGRFAVSDDGKELLVGVTDKAQFRIPLDKIAKTFAKEFRESYKKEHGEDLPERKHKEYAIVVALRAARDRIAQEREEAKRKREAERRAELREN